LAYIKKLHLFLLFKDKTNQPTLGAVDLSSLFLQQFVGYLYKAEFM